MSRTAAAGGDSDRGSNGSLSGSSVGYGSVVDGAVYGPLGALKDDDDDDDLEKIDSRVRLTTGLVSSNSSCGGKGDRSYSGMVVERNYEIDGGRGPSRCPPGVRQSYSKAALTAMETSVHHKSGLDGRKALLRRVAIGLSLYVNVAILLAKLVAYARTLSLSVLAALVDSILDVISQLILSFTEHKSERLHGRSSAMYPAGAARLEPIGVLTCAALMGMASFEVLSKSLEALIFDQNVIEGEHFSSVWSMLAIVVIKILLLLLCQKAGEHGRRGRKGFTGNLGHSKAVVVVPDPTLEALAQDHLNDALSNALAAVALLTALWHPSLWFFDPVGAIVISIYIIYSWYVTGKEQIEQLTGKAAPDDFIEEMLGVASNHDSRLVVDVCRAYHFGPKFLVELEVVLPPDTLLQESHDVGMELQYEIEAREEVERCFVHIDYEKRGYDEHVVSKNPELREKYRAETLCRRAVSI